MKTLRLCRFIPALEEEVAGDCGTFSLISGVGCMFMIRISIATQVINLDYMFSSSLATYAAFDRDRQCGALCLFTHLLQQVSIRFCGSISQLPLSLLALQSSVL